VIKDEAGTTSTGSTRRRHGRKRPTGRRPRPARRDGAGTTGRRDGASRQRNQPEPPAPPLSAEAIAGKQPLRSFSELKQLWEQRAE